MSEHTEWIAVEATVETEAAADAVVFALSEMGAEGTSYSLLAEPGAQATGKVESGAQATGKVESGAQATGIAKPGAQATGSVESGAPRVTVSGYFDAVPDVQAVESKVLEALGIYGFDHSSLHSIESREVIDQDWLAEWKKHWKPTVTGKFIIAPPWQEVEPEGRIVITIEPKMAFGTGTHETTRLCLKAIESLYVPGMSFLDVGTGTGILAIAAAKLSPGNAEVEGCDTDPEAVSAAVENAELNGCQEITFRAGSIDADTRRFDFVCANLTTDVILSILPLLLERSEKTLVLSGILKEKCASVTDELEALGVSGAQVNTDGEWVSITVRKAD